MKLEAKNKFYTVVSEMNLDGQVMLLGFIPKHELVALYDGAIVFVYPSQYEGFGMPLLETKACGAPVVNVTAGSILEVSPNAALFINPKVPEEIAHSILQIISDY